MKHFSCFKVLIRKKLKKLQRVVQQRAEELNMAPELLGRKKHLLELLRHFGRSNELMWLEGESAWRKPLLEDEFRKIMNPDSESDG